MAKKTAKAAKGNEAKMSRRAFLRNALVLAGAAAAGAAIHEVASKPSGAVKRVSSGVKRQVSNGANYVSNSVPGKAVRKVGSTGGRIATKAINHPARTGFGALGGSYIGHKIGEKAAKKGVPKYIVTGGQILVAAGGADSPALGIAGGAAAAGWTTLKQKTRERAIIASAQAAKNVFARGARAAARGARTTANAARRRIPARIRRRTP